MIKRELQSAADDRHRRPLGADGLRAPRVGDAGRRARRTARSGTDLGSGEGMLIYPEGTRTTAEKLARAQEIIAERQPEIAPLANGLQNVLPPRLGGPARAARRGARALRRRPLRPRGLRRLPAHQRHLGGRPGRQRRSRSASGATPPPRSRRTRRTTDRSGSTRAGRSSTTGSASSACRV